MLTTFLQLELNIAAEAADKNLPFSSDLELSPGLFITRILAAIMAIAAILVLIALVLGALEYITSGGDKGKIEKAREKMTQSVIGMFVLASVMVIFGVLQAFLGINILSLTSAGSSNGTGTVNSGTSSGFKFFGQPGNSSTRTRQNPIPEQEQIKSGSVPRLEN